MCNEGVILFVCVSVFYVYATAPNFSLQWNSHGYDIAKTFARKFTHISPVWLQLTRRCAVYAHSLWYCTYIQTASLYRHGVGLAMEGTHDIDQG